MGPVQNRFILTSGSGMQSRLRRLKNGVPQESVLFHLSNLLKRWTKTDSYAYNLPSFVSKKYAYADDLALMHTSDNWKSLQGFLIQDIAFTL